MCLRTRTFGAEVLKSSIRATRLHNKSKILNYIEKHDFCLNDLLTKSKCTTLQSYKVDRGTNFWDTLKRTVLTKFSGYPYVRPNEQFHKSTFKKMRICR